MSRINKKPLLFLLQTMIEEQEQAELGWTLDGHPVSYYTTRPLKALIETLELIRKKKNEK